MPWSSIFNFFYALILVIISKGFLNTYRKKRNQMDLYFCLLSFFIAINFFLVSLSLLLFPNNPCMVWLIGEMFANLFVFLSLAVAAVSLSAASLPRVPWYPSFIAVILWGIFLLGRIYKEQSYPILNEGLVFWKTPPLLHIGNFPLGGILLTVVLIYVAIGWVFIRRSLRFSKNRIRVIIFSIALPILTVSLGWSYTDVTSYIVLQIIALVLLVVIYLIVATRKSSS